MIRAWWVGTAMAVVIAAIGLFAALADPSHWYVMFPLYIIAGGSYLLAGASPSPLAGAGVSSRRPTTSFGPPPGVFTGGWGAVISLTGLVLFVDIFASALGWVLLFVWIAAVVIVLFVVSQVRGRVTHGS